MCLLGGSCGGVPGAMSAWCSGKKVRSLEAEVADLEEQRSKTESCVKGTFRNNTEVFCSCANSFSAVVEKEGLRKGGHPPKEEGGTTP